MITQVFTIYAARWVVKRAQEESNVQKDAIVSHFDSELASIRAEIPTSERVAALESRVEAFQQDFGEFAHALGQDIASLPKRLEMKVYSQAGTEQRIMQKALEEAGTDLEKEVSLQEALAMEDPELVSRLAMKRVAEFEPSKKWSKEHPVLAAALEAGKPLILNTLQGVLYGTPTKRVRENVDTSSPYGV